MEIRPLSDQTSIRDVLARIVQNETGEADEESQFVADAILASRVIRYIKGEGLREAAASGAFGTGAQSTLLARAARIEKGGATDG